MKSINVKIDQQPINYSIEIGEGILSNAFNLINADSRIESYIIIYDKAINKSKIMEVLSSFPALNTPHLIPINLSKQKKSFDGFNYIRSELIKYSCDKSTALIAIGGGSIGDLVGFIAATFYRGINYIQIPSTLLSMIDSSIGGKTAIDTKDGKNLIGSYHHPNTVVLDPSMLDAIDKAEINSGLFEAIKYGLALDSNFFEYLSDNIDDLKEMINLTPLIERCCQLKVNIIQEDERDNSERQKLNFGHTIGHAIESIYNLKHGEAVGYGMIAACHISELMGTLSSASHDSSIALIQRLLLPKIKPNGDLIIDQIKRDKKRSSGKNNFILLNEIGNSYISNNVTDDIIKKAISIL